MNDPFNAAVGYAYDAAGNRTSLIYPDSRVISYVYDAAHRLTSVSEGQSELAGYEYTSNKLSSISGENLNVAFQYNGLGDRLSQTVNGVTTYYALDQAAPLTQVLSDGTNDYLYGLDRIAQVNGSVTEYFLTDALGSVRQLADNTGAVTLARSYQPYGTQLSTAGSGASTYGFTGEQQSQGLVYLRSRYYLSAQGRFITRDTWGGDANRPMSFNRWNYAHGDPVNYKDPTGMWALANFKKLGANAPEWTQLEKQAANNAVIMVAAAYAKAYNEEMVNRAFEYCGPDLYLLVWPKKIYPISAFQAIHNGPISFWHLEDTSMKFFEPKEREFDDYNEYLRKHKEYWQNPTKVWGQKRDENDIYIFSNYSTAQLENDLGRNTRFFMHEIGHAFNHAVTKKTILNPYNKVTGDLKDPEFGGYAGKKLDWQFSSNNTLAGEHFADMFIGWVYQKWGSDELGHGMKRKQFMDDNMPFWIAAVIGNR